MYIYIHACMYVCIYVPIYECVICICECMYYVYLHVCKPGQPFYRNLEPSRISVAAGSRARDR